MQSLLNRFQTHISELKSVGFFDELQEDMIDPELHTDRFNTQRQNNWRHSRIGSKLEQHRQQMADSIQDALEKLYDGFYDWSHKEINKGQWWGYLGVNYHPAKYYNMFVQVGCAHCRKVSEPISLLYKPHDLINFLHLLRQYHKPDTCNFWGELQNRFPERDRPQQLEQTTYYCPHHQLVMQQRPRSSGSSLTTSDDVEGESSGGDLLV